MSFFTTSTHTLAVSAWPSNLQNAILRYSGDHVNQTELRFPFDLEGLAEFGEVMEDPAVTNPFRNKCFVYKLLPHTTTCEIRTISCRLHGFLKHFQLSTFGNWDGTPSSAHSAIQHVILSGGNCRAAWDAQLHGLNLAREFFARSLKISVPGKPYEGMLRLKRNVFDKFTEGSAKPNVADPFNWLAQVEKQWTMRTPLPIANVDEKNGVSGIHQILLTPGDFVEIDVEFDLVVEKRSSHGRVLRVYLAFNHIVRLSKARKESMPMQSEGKKRNHSDTSLDAPQRCVKRHQAKIQFASKPPSENAGGGDQQGTHVHETKDIRAPERNAGAETLDKMMEDEKQSQQK